jgi:hypothetical protein
MEHEVFSENRRDFLTKIVPLAALACFGCKRSAVQKLVSDSTGKLPENPGMSTEENYSFFYGMFIPLLQSLQKEMGNEKFIELITKTSTEGIGNMITSMTKDIQEKDLKAFSSFFKDLLATPPYNSVLTFEIVEQTERVLEFKFTECLPAKLLRSMNAVDIGLALECSGGEAACKAFNPKINYSNPKNLMKGDIICIERYTLDT